MVKNWQKHANVIKVWPLSKTAFLIIQNIVKKSSRKNKKSIIFFRTFDGSCNNKRNPKYGQALTPLQRVLPNAYADQILTPRRARNRGPLPSARWSTFVKI